MGPILLATLVLGATAVGGVPAPRTATAVAPAASAIASPAALTVASAAALEEASKDVQEMPKAAPLVPALVPAGLLPSTSPLSQLPSAPAFQNFPAVSSSSGLPPWGLAGAALLILSLAFTTLWLQKRRRQGTRHIQILETIALGPKRSLSLVLLGQKSLLISSCEGGISLICAQPVSAEMLQTADQAQAFPATAAVSARNPSSDEPSLETRGRPAAPFAAQLAEAEETQGLRRRLSEAGMLR
jgi:flagellar biogenesis protein FliO